MKYRREIDGLRALAVLPVIFFHAGFDLFSGGYVGVDIFFVISGYLITSILIDEFEKERFSVTKFYERRARRILPALCFVMICCVPFAWMWMLPSQFIDFSHALLAVSIFASNILFWKKTDYFAADAEENPLLHTWSLAVEEQFYIFFPILLLLLWRFGRCPTFYVILAISILSLLLAEWGWRNAPSANFYMLPSRAWELGAGSICAFLMHWKKQQGANEVLSATGLALIVFSIFYYDRDTPFPSLYTLAPVGGTALIILYGSYSTLVAKFLSTSALVGIGLISYSAYLWHQPIFAFVRIRSLTDPEPELMVTLSIATLGLAYLSWRYVEYPFRKKHLPLLPSPTSAFAAVGFVTCTFIVMGLYGHLSKGRLAVWEQTHAALSQTYHLIERARNDQGKNLDNSDCIFNVPVLTDQIIARIERCHSVYGVGTAIIGDSHGMDLFNGMYFNYEGKFLFGMNRGVCRVHAEATRFGNRNCTYGEFFRLISANPQLFEKIIYTQAGFSFLEKKVGLRVKRGRSIFASVSESAEIEPESYRVISSDVDAVVEYLESLSMYTHVVWIGPKIEPHIDNNYIIKYGCDHVYKLRPGLTDVFLYLDITIAQSLDGRRVKYVPQTQITGFSMETDFIDCSNFYWSDGDHWSLHGASQFVKRLLADKSMARQVGENAD